MFLCEVPQREKCYYSVWLLPHFDESVPHTLPWDLLELQHMDSPWRQTPNECFPPSPCSLESQGCGTEQSPARLAWPLSSAPQPFLPKYPKIQCISCEHCLQQGMGAEIQMPKSRMFRHNEGFSNGSVDWKWHTHLCSAWCCEHWAQLGAQAPPKHEFRQWGRRL